MTQDALVERLRPFIKVSADKQDKLEKFFSKCVYFKGAYDTAVCVCYPSAPPDRPRLRLSVYNYNYSLVPTETRRMQGSFTELNAYLTKLETDLKHTVRLPTPTRHGTSTHRALHCVNRPLIS
jgi:hypothetical protein